MEAVSEPAITHVAFSDESHWNIGRYRSVGLVTLPMAALPSVECCLQQILCEASITELKFEKLRQARERFAACKVVEKAIELADRGLLRIDVLMWDTHDSRHAIKARDDVANLQRMYYHLLKNVLRRRWPTASNWLLCPDEHSALDWESMYDFLDWAGVDAELTHDLLAGPSLALLFRRLFQIEAIEPASSAKPPLVQVADLFAGLAVFSRDDYSKYRAWEKRRAPTLFDIGDDETMSASDRERSCVLDHLNALCKGRRLGVSLDTWAGLRSPNPAKPINFWWYEPQHPNDTAPTTR